MSIKFTPGAPTDSVEKLHSWEPEIMRAASFRVAGDGDSIQLGDAYEVRYITAKDIAEKNLLGSGGGSARGCWRHLVMAGGQPVGELELDEQHEPVAFHEGPSKDGLHAALEAARKLDGDFEVSVVQSTPLRFIALLLHSDLEDLIMPFAPDATALTNYSPVSVADALEVLKPMAEEVIEATSGEEPTGG